MGLRETQLTRWGGGVGGGREGEDGGGGGGERVCGERSATASINMVAYIIM